MAKRRKANQIPEKPEKPIKTTTAATRATPRCHGGATTALPNATTTAAYDIGRCSTVSTANG
jgi:hypothetical protein